MKQQSTEASFAEMSAQLAAENPELREEGQESTGEVPHEVTAEQIAEFTPTPEDVRSPEVIEQETAQVAVLQASLEEQFSQRPASSAAEIEKAHEEALLVNEVVERAGRELLRAPHTSSRENDIEKTDEEEINELLEGVSLEELMGMVKKVEAEQQKGRINHAAKAYVEHQRLSIGHEQVIQTHEALESSSLNGGINETEFIKLKDDGSVVFKPAEGEKTISEQFEKGTLYKRERAAYIIDQYFQFGLVPPTVVREVDGKFGSAQEFIPGTKPGTVFMTGFTKLEEFLDLKGKLMRYTHRDELKKLWIFDQIIWNTDRHHNNFLFKEGKIFAIDNGLSFNTKHKEGAEDPLKWKLRIGEKYNSYYDQDVPEETARMFAEFLSDAQRESDLRQDLSELLEQQETDALIERIKTIGGFLKEGRTPSAKTALVFNPHLQTTHHGIS